MNVKEAIQARRAYRAFDPVEITDEMVRDLAECASLSASCFNNQPWRFVFVRDKGQLERMKSVMSKGNEWTSKASMIIAVFCRKTDDCVIKDREYYLFDAGMATAHLILRATELELVAHPIAGFSPQKAREVLGIPEEYDVITLVNLGKRSQDLTGLSEKQLESEKERPERRKFDEFVYLDRFQ